MFGAYSRQVRPPHGVSLYLKKKVVESHVYEKKENFARIDSLKQGSVELERKIILEVTRGKGVENVVFKSGVDFNCIFSAMVKKYVGNYVKRRTHGFVCD